MRLTKKTMVEYLAKKLEQKKKEYQEVMNIPPDGSDMLCEYKIDVERGYNEYKDNNQDEYRYVKLGQLEDIEEEFEIDDLDDLRDRLNTYKFLANHEMSCVDVNAYNLMLKDLDEYHRIEEELGIDLVTLLKAIINEYIFIKQNNEIYENNVEFSINKDENGYYINLETCHFNHLYFKDYGKTWALTREELDL